jgi:hypothetical protein
VVGGGLGWPDGADGTVFSDSFSSPYWGFVLECEQGECGSYGAMGASNVTLTGTESQSPSITPLGSNNIWYQGGHYIWNPPGDPWQFAMSASDPSGVCDLYAEINASQVQGPAAWPNQSELQQCPEPGWIPTVDTRAYVPQAGSLGLQMVAMNAAGNTSSPSETLQVDNDPVSVTISDQNDPNPAGWVNHAVSVNASASTGPSGVGGIACAVDGGASAGASVQVNGDGVHTVKCTGWNRAVSPQGWPQFATTTQTVHIDETPPSLGFEAQNPADPAQLVVDTADSESGVGGGSIEMARGVEQLDAVGDQLRRPAPDRRRSTTRG